MKTENRLPARKTYAKFGCRSKQGSIFQTGSTQNWRKTGRSYIVTAAATENQ